MLGHVDHIGKIEEERHRFTAMYRSDSHPVALRTSVRLCRITAIEVESDVPSVDDVLQLLPVWIFRFNLEGSAGKRFRSTLCYSGETAGFSPADDILLHER